MIEDEDCEALMQIDWGKTVNDILDDKISCPRCGRLESMVHVGYSRSSSAAEYAPRCQNCSRKEGCEARKLVVVCEACAKDFHIRASAVDKQGMMTLLLNDCRKDLEDCLDYLADYWQEDLEVSPEEEDGTLEGVAPDVFEEEDAWRRQLEEEYLSYHRWFRERGVRISNAHWRSEYVEEVIALGYTTLLGD
jgi:transcription elongation factor Elf1